jgi:serine protease Do
MTGLWRRLVSVTGLLGLTLFAGPALGQTTAPATRPAATTLPSVPAKPAPATLPAAILKSAPDDLRDLKILQEQVKSVVNKVAPAVVGLRVNRGLGSGVIVTPDGYVLTAGHVSGSPDQTVIVVMNDGRIVKGKTLGVNYGVDGGMIKIVEQAPEGGWPYVEMGISAPLRKAQWCIAMGHPGGYKVGRTPPVRLGRILDTRSAVIRTDCTLVGGDSGGPLFDLAGRVIGIHSRIGTSVTDNLHVPVDTYRESWERLVKGDAWGMRMGGRPGSAYLGFQVAPNAKDCTIGDVYPDSPASRAGLKAGDVITSVDGEKLNNFGELMQMLSNRRPGDQLTLEVKREDRTLTIKVTVGRQPRGQN